MSGTEAAVADNVGALVALVEVWGAAHYEAALAGDGVALHDRLGGESWGEALDRIPLLAVAVFEGADGVRFCRFASELREAQTALGAARRQAERGRTYEAGRAVGRAEVTLNVAAERLHEIAEQALRSE